HICKTDSSCWVARWCSLSCGCRVRNAVINDPRVSQLQTLVYVVADCHICHRSIAEPSAYIGQDPHLPALHDPCAPITFPALLNTPRHEVSWTNRLCWLKKQQPIRTCTLIRMLLNRER